MIERNGTPSQKRMFLPDLISGEKIASLAMSEPTAGSDVMSMKLSAKKTKVKFLLGKNFKLPVGEGLLCVEWIEILDHERSVVRHIGRLRQDGHHHEKQQRRDSRG